MHDVSGAGACLALAAGAWRRWRWRRLVRVHSIHLRHASHLLPLCTMRCQDGEEGPESTSKGAERSSSCSCSSGASHTNSHVSVARGRAHATPLLLLGGGEGEGKVVALAARGELTDDDGEVGLAAGCIMRRRAPVGASAPTSSSSFAGSAASRSRSQTRRPFSRRLTKSGLRLCPLNHPAVRISFGSAGGANAAASPPDLCRSVSCCDSWRNSENLFSVDHVLPSTVVRRRS